MKKSFYEILEVSNSASRETIDAVYLVLQKKYSSVEGEHEPGATEQLKFIRIAYGVISDPTKRAVYDKRLAKTSAEPPLLATPSQAQQPTSPPPGPTLAEPAALIADKEVVATPIDLIAQIKEASRKTGPREDFGERIFSIAAKPLVAVIIGLVFAGSITYKFMKPETRSNSPAALVRQGTFNPDPLAAAALNTAQKLGISVETGINYQEYSTAVPGLAVQIKAYMASAGAGKNPKLTSAVEKILDAHVKAKDIWAIKDEHPDLFPDVDADNDSYRKVLGIYPLAGQMAKPQDERGQRVTLDIDAVLNALWQDARRAFNDAKRLNSGTT